MSFSGKDILLLNPFQLSQSRPGAPVGQVAQIVTINGQQHILVPKQQQPQIQAAPTTGQQPSSVNQAPSSKPNRPVVASSIAATPGSPASAAKTATAGGGGGGGFIVVRPPGLAQQQLSSVIASTSTSGAPCVVQTAGGSIILQQPVNPQSAPQQPIIAAVRLPNGQTQQILLNTEQVVAHQQLAALQAMSPTAGKPHRLIAPSPRMISVVT